MHKVTSPYCRILENDVVTNCEFKCWKQNIFNVAIFVDFNPLLHKSQCWLPIFVDCSPHHEGPQLVLAENCSHGVINVCWTFGINSVVLIVDSCFNSPGKKSLALLWQLLVPQEEALLFKIYCNFRQVWGSVSFSSCREITRDHFWFTHIHVFSYLQIFCISFALYPFLDSFNHFLCLNNAWSSDVRSSLNLFTTWYTVGLTTFKSLIISEFVLPEQQSWITVWSLF